MKYNFNIQQQQQPVQVRRRSTLILMDQLHFRPENFFQYDTDSDDDHDDE